MKLGEMRRLPQGHRANEWQSSDTKVFQDQYSSYKNNSYLEIVYA
jgi:hypothetical protein